MQQKHLCHHCGTEWTEHHKPGRRDVCSKCGHDLRVCLNCTHYDPRYAQECRETRAEPVHDKAAANFCDDFRFVLRSQHRLDSDSSEQDQALERLKKLLGD